MPELTPKALELIARAEARKIQLRKDQERLAAIERRRKAEENELKYGGPENPFKEEDSPLDTGNTQDRYAALRLSEDNGKCTTRRGTYYRHKYGDGRCGFNG